MIDIKELLKDGLNNGASDIHLVFNSKPLMRIRKDLVPVEKYPVLKKEDMWEILDFFVKDNEEKKNTLKREKILDIHYDMEDMRVRINVSISEEYPIYTVRIIKSILPSFYTLGLPDIVKKMAMQPQGMILITGKPNSGKSTTLSALVNEINKTEKKKILMLESPIEYVHKSENSLIIQKEVGEGGDCLSFSDGARNALREDCDILVIGEIRDKETMDAAIEMAESGHLVIGTLHTKSCAETMDRLITFYDQSEQSTVKFLISSLIKMVVTQRLIKGSNNQLVLVPEIMVVDNVIASYIRREKFSISEIEDAIHSRSDIGNRSFINSLAELVLSEQITMEQAKEQIDEKNYEMFNRILKQKRLKE